MSRPKLEGHYGSPTENLWRTGVKGEGVETKNWPNQGFPLHCLEDIPVQQPEDKWTEVIKAGLMLSRETTA